MNWSIVSWYYTEGRGEEEGLFPAVVFGDRFCLSLRVLNNF